jgi:putative hemolysin
MSALQIDVKQAIASKNKKLANLLPRFIIRWIEKLIHQDELNYNLEKFQHDTSIEFAQNIIGEMLHTTIQVVHEEKIPKEGRYIVVSNHPLGAIDGLALIALLGRYRTDIKFPVNDLLLAIKPMNDIFLPINKHGRNDKEAATELHNTFASDNLVLYFPAGLCSRKIKGVIQDLEWKKTIIQKAVTYQRDIIPVFFEGKNSNRFYRIANWRKWLGIKTNLEMILLPDEMIKQKGKTFTIIFGDPISHSTFDSSKTSVEWAAWLREQTIKLKSELRF